MASYERSVVLSAPPYTHVNEKWFVPDYWGNQATPVEAGGRGSAWFIKSNSGQFVLRHYRRGGFATRLSQRRYLFTGYTRTRSFAEFKLTNELYDKGLPVPKPVAALAHRCGWFTYEAGILIERIEGAQPVPECRGAGDEALWHRIGQTIGLFHREGLDHVDMNCDNILVTGECVYLIDFDRCKLRTKADLGAGWKSTNLNRLRRSVDKRLGALSEQQRADIWQALMAGYHAS